MSQQPTSLTEREKWLCEQAWRRAWQVSGTATTEEAAKRCRNWLLEPLNPSDRSKYPVDIGGWLAQQAPPGPRAGTEPAGATLVGGTAAEAKDDPTPGQDDPKKPPLGVMPEALWRQLRREDLAGAIKRHIDYGVGGELVGLWCDELKMSYKRKW